LIPFRDTVERKGPVTGILVAILIAVALVPAGIAQAGNLWQLLLGLLGLWLFGYYPARRLGTPVFLAIWVALLLAAGLLAAATGGDAFQIPLLPAVFAVGLLHLALAPRSEIICLLPFPFAMTFLEVPTAALLAVWVLLEVLLSLI
jgi:membrane associated rhomboid family serine protease